MGRRQRRGDIDSTYSALRPRMGTLQTRGTGVATGTIPPHSHSADQISFEPSNLLDGDDLQETGEELDFEKLARSGVQPMLGNLDMNHYSINNIHDADIEGTATVGEDVVMTGPIGLARVTNPRVISMAGDHIDDEAKVQNLERVVFNNEPTASSIELPSRIELNTGVTAGTSYTAAVGKVSWDTLEDTLIAYVVSGASVVVIALGWAATIAACGNNP